MRMSLVACGCGALAIAISGSARAQEFQVFDHDLSRVEVTTDEGRAFNPTAIYLGKPDGSTAYIDRSFKEALYEPLIRQAEARYQLPPRLLQALIWQESRFNPMAISPAGHTSHLHHGSVAPDSRHRANRSRNARAASSGTA